MPTTKRRAADKRAVLALAFVLEGADEQGIVDAMAHVAGVVGDNRKVEWALMALANSRLCAIHGSPWLADVGQEAALLWLRGEMEADRKARAPSRPVQPTLMDLPPPPPPEPEDR